MAKSFKDKIKLSNQEKSGMRSALLSYVKFNPVRVKANSRPIEYKRNMFAFISNFKKRSYVMPALILVIVVTLTGGTAFAADASLPGDALYPVKVEVNERVRSAFSFSNESKAELSVDLAEERLEELAKLAQRGELNAEAVAQIEENFVSFEERAQARIENLREEGREDLAVQIATRLETALNAHAQVLERLSARGDAEIEMRLDSVINRVRSGVNSAAKMRIRAENEASSEIDSSSGSTMTISRVKNQAESKVNHVTTLLIRAENEISAEAKTRAEAKIQTAQEAIVEAEVKAEQRLYSEALRLYYQAIGLAEEVKQSIRAQTDFQIDLRFDQRTDLETSGSDTRSTTESRTDADLEAGSETEIESRNTLDLDESVENSSSAEIRIGN